jgi:hypothetical protein
VIFMLTSITLSYFGSSSTSVMATRAKAAAPAKDEAKGEAKNDDAKKIDDATAPTGGAAKPANVDAAKEAAPVPAAPSTP